MKSKLNEGLRANDLKELFYPDIEIDTFSSKMGEDADVCVLTFQAKDRHPARDFMEFVEKGYDFVLDADISAGENEQGEYSVFVEIARNPQLANQITELMYGARKLTGITEWQFRYYKDSKSYDLNEDNIRNVVPHTGDMYEGVVNKFRTEETKSFFDKTLMDDFVLEGNKITIKKPFGIEVKLEKLDVDDPQSVLEGAEAMDESSIAEMFWMTKVLGNYNIRKYGDAFLFTNEDKAMLLKRRS